MKIHNPSITGSLIVSGSNVKVDFTTVDNGVSGSLSGSFTGALQSKDITNALTRTTISGSTTSLSSSVAADVAANLVSITNNSSSVASDVAANLVSITNNSSSVAADVAANLVSITTNSSSFASRYTNQINQDLRTTASPTFADATITGTLTAQEVHTEFESASIIFTSGSTKFGDSGGDIHNMTGSIRVSGSLANESFINGHNVGIGTENPIATLDVHSDELGMVLRTGDSGRIGMALMNSGTGTATNFTDGLIIKLDSDESGYVGLAADNPSKFLHLGAANSNVITISGSGTVGIGTNDTADTDILFVTDGADHYAGANRMMQIKRDATNGNDTTSFASLLIGNNSNGFVIGYGGTTDRFRFLDGGGVERVSILNGGNVGIGTTAPSGSLNTSSDGEMVITFEADANNSGQENCYIKFLTDGETQEGIVGMDNNDSSTLFNGNTENAMVFGCRSNLPVLFATNNTERMQITADGKVGIGTATPLATLHVEHTTDDTDENGNIALTVGGGANGNVRHYFGINNSGNYAYQGAVEHATQYVPLILQPNGAKVGIGDTIPEGKLTVNQGADDTAILSLKSTDVAHPFTGYHNSQSYFVVQKYSNSEGGANLRGYSEGERGLSMSHFGTSFDSPSNGTGVDKGMQFFAYDSSGTSVGNINSNGTCFIFRAYKGGSTQTIFMIDEDGDLHSDGSTSITGYDYAEMFEWEDGNSSNEDRVGYSVVFGSSGDKIRVASGSEEPFGVVSARPGVIGDNPMGWKGMWKTDEWDRKIPKLVPMVSWSYDFTRDTGEVIQKTFKIEISQTGSFLNNISVGSSERGVSHGGSIPSNANYYNKEESQLSDDYDDTLDYTTRRGRKEWDTIGLMGKLKIRTGQATGSRWIKMKDVSDTIQLWLVK